MNRQVEWMTSFATWTGEDPGRWAQAREAEGWAALGVSDHISTGGGPCLHAFPVLGLFAAHTERVRMFPCFGNNLVRSPAEFAQLASSMQVLSAGRFEAGIGAGWDEQEIVSAGLDYPPGPARARRFLEAVLVVKALLAGECRFEGEFYNVDMPGAGPQVDPPPPLFAALGGRWTIRNIGPHVDRIELFANAPAFRTGVMDFSKLGRVSRDEFRRLIDLAREVAPNARIGGGFFVGAGDHPGVRFMAKGFGDGFCQGLAGSPTQVADTLHGWAAEGLDHVSVLPPFDGTLELLTPLLLEQGS